MVFPLKSLFRARRDDGASSRLYGIIVAQARRPEFYCRLGVPDQPIGRFSMLALHCFLLLERLARDPSSAALGQAVFDAMVADVDRNLREMGVGDLSVGRKVKALVRHFYGMAEACRDGLRAGDDVLAAALSRNVYGETIPDSKALQDLVEYVRATSAALACQPMGELLSGKPAFAAIVKENGDVSTG